MYPNNHKFEILSLCLFIFSVFGPCLCLCFFPLFGPFGFVFAFLPFSDLLIVPLLHFVINPCVYFMCRNGWILHNHKWIYGIMHNWRSKGCKKDVSKVKGKNTIQLKGSTPNCGFIAFENHGNSLQSSFFM
jgi:hypothetical protein